jgi:LPS-assembly protein
MSLFGNKNLFKLIYMKFYNINSKSISKLLIISAFSASFFVANQVFALEKKDNKNDEKNKSQQQKSQQVEKSYLESDSLTFDQNMSDAIATGNVRIDHQERKLNADKVIYNQTTNNIQALGNVELTNDDGSKYFADKVATNSNISTGFAENIRGVLADGSVLESKNAELVTRKKLIMYDAVYSPCKVCDEGKYFWSIKADRVKYNEKTGRVGYRNATLNFFDVPVIYSPFISHPTPNAKSKSGFLTPSFGSSDDLGFNITAPYYWQPASNYDITITPRISFTESPVLGLEHRHLLKNGEYKFATSGTYPEARDDFGNIAANGDREFRGHIEGVGNFELNDDWDFKFDGKRASDDTYLRRFRFGQEDLLTSTASVEKLEGRNFTEVKTVSFQGLRANDDPSKTPFVLPIVNHHYEKKLDTNNSLGGSFGSLLANSFLTSDFNMMHLDRDEGAKSRRISQKIGVNKKQITAGGSMLEYGVSTRADGYNFEDATYNNNVIDSTRGRVIPQADVKWSMPLIKRFESSSLVIEPVVNSAVSPNGNNSDLIPNEDSQSIEFADYNLFEDSRYSGLDRVESGMRTSYGLRSNLYNQNIGNLGMVLGQIYRSAKDRYLTPETGMSDNLSDYVGRFTLDNGKYFSTNYRFRVNKRDFKFERNEVGANFSIGQFGLGTNYSFVNGKNGGIDRQEVGTAASLGFAENWRVFSNATNNLDNAATKGMVTAGSGLEFSNECLKASFEVKRDFIRDRDIEPSTEFLFKFTLQNVGMD